MKIVATSDWHLGYQAYPRLTPDGINVRERDVAQAFERMIGQIIKLAPDVVLVAGDVFHSNRPTNRAIIHASKQLGRLKGALTRCEIVIVGGNHDLPRVNDTGCILPLFAGVGVHVVDREAIRLRFGELAILCIPDGLGMQRPALVPDASARYNVLLVHGELTGVTQGGADRRVGLNEITPAELTQADWDYVALGHYHEAEAVGLNAWYSGAIEHTSSNIWIETKPKGFIEFSFGEQGTKTWTFHPIPGVRPVFDLEPIEATDLAPIEVDAVIAMRLAMIPDGAIVRLIVNEIPRDVGHALDQKMIREAKRRFLHFNLDLRRPDPMERIREVTTERKKQLERLPDRVRRTFSERALPTDVDRDEFVSKGMDYFGETEDAASSVLQQQLTESLEKSE